MSIDLFELKREEDAAIEVLNYGSEIFKEYQEKGDVEEFIPKMYRLLGKVDGIIAQRSWDFYIAVQDFESLPQPVSPETTAVHIAKIYAAFEKMNEATRKYHNQRIQSFKITFNGAPDWITAFFEREILSPYDYFAEMDAEEVKDMQEWLPGEGIDWDDYAQELIREIISQTADSQWSTKRKHDVNFDDTLLSTIINIVLDQVDWKYYGNEFREAYLNRVKEITNG